VRSGGWAGMRNIPISIANPFWIVVGLEREGTGLRGDDEQNTFARTKHLLLASLRAGCGFACVPPMDIRAFGPAGPAGPRGPVRGSEPCICNGVTHDERRGSGADGRSPVMASFTTAPGRQPRSGTLASRTYAEAASARFVACSFRSTLLTWDFTVPAEITSSSAIC